MTYAARWRDSVRRAVAATALYFVVVLAAAVSAAVSESKEPALLVWICSTLMLFGLSLRQAYGAALLTGPLRRAAALTLAFGIVCGLALVAFVVMVNVWEHLGLGH